MVLFTRRTTAKPGKYFDIIKWAKEIAEYVNNKHNISLSVYSQSYGENPNGTIFWTANVESMSAFEDVSNALIQDEGYLALLSKGIELYVGGTTYDNFLVKH
ncbi:MAG: hypothetical protein GPJ54_02970 [Candidatus Heimdallarchaeota archaeon]|nr:hypothetical protein [Candidatus Heimdallarchaeota archaeon]